MEVDAFGSFVYTVTDTIKYETNYKDEEGNIHYWIDTDEFYCGDIPPETDQDTRWVIAGMDEEGREKKYRLQVKE